MPARKRLTIRLTKAWSNSQVLGAEPVSSFALCFSPEKRDPTPFPFPEAVTAHLASHLTGWDSNLRSSG